MFNFFKISILILGCAWDAGVITYANTAIDHFNLILSATGRIGEANDITVEAMDASNSIIQSYTGYVFFQSDTDFSATLPAQGKAIQFKGSDNGVLKISKGVTFKRVGNQELMVTEAREDATGITNILITGSSEEKQPTLQQDRNKYPTASSVNTQPITPIGIRNTRVKIRSIKVIRSGKNTILQWSLENPQDKKRISDYIIQYRERGVTLDHTTLKKPVSKNTFFIIKGLPRNKEYDFTISPVVRDTAQSSTQTGEIFFGNVKAQSLGVPPTLNNSNDIISAALMPSMIAYLKRSRDAARSAHLNTIATALGAYYSDTETYPKTSESGCIPKELDNDFYLPKGVPTDPIEKRVTPGCNGNDGTYAYRAIWNNKYRIYSFILGVKMENEIGGNSNLPIDKITSDMTLARGSGDMYYIIY